MPQSAPRICPRAGCSTLVISGLCQKHADEYAARPRTRGTRKRDSASRRGYDRRWQKYRKEYLTTHPVCSCGMPATVVDHIIPHKGDVPLFWNTGNHQPLCASCHSKKTASIDGGFGNAIT